jgi:hypothetical protein
MHKDDNPTKCVDRWVGKMYPQKQQQQHEHEHNKTKCLRNFAISEILFINILPFYFTSPKFL